MLLGSVDDVEIGELTFIIWDAAVPALPVGGALLLGALLLWRGAVQTHGRDDCLYAGAALDVAVLALGGRSPPSPRRPRR